MLYKSLILSIWGVVGGVHCTCTCMCRRKAPSLRDLGKIGINYEALRTKLLLFLVRYRIAEIAQISK